MNDKDCGGSSFWDCSPKDILDAGKDFTREAWETVRGSLVVAATQVWEFLKGCAPFVGEVFGSVREMVTQLGQLAADPQKFVDEKLQLARTVKAAVREDGEAFAIEVLGGMVDRDLFNQNKAKWAGKLAWEVAVTVLTGGVGGVGGRFAKQFADMNKFLRTIDDWLSGRRNGNNGNDPDGDSDATTAGDVPGRQLQRLHPGPAGRRDQATDQPGPRR